MSARRAYLDEAAGEARGVVTLGGLPERLFLHRSGDRPEHQPGARLAARVRRIDRALGMAFLDLGLEPDAVLSLAGAALTEGQRVEIELLAPPREDKGPVGRLVGPAEGEPRLLAEAPSMPELLRRAAPEATVVRGPAAREAADAAEAAALEVEHRLPSGGRITIEPTRALVAIDVDVGQASGDQRRAALRANREAIAAAARLLRLKGMGGPVVFDLAGKGHDGEALKAEAVAAFAPDQPGVALGPITRFGLWPLTLPRRAQPISEQLCRVDGALSDQTLVLHLLRAIERAAGPGERVEARAAPAIAVLAEGLAPLLVERIGPRFRILADGARSRDAPGIGPWENGR